MSGRSTEEREGHAKTRRRKEQRKGKKIRKIALNGDARDAWEKG